MKSSPSGGSSPATALALACAAVRAPGITVLTPSCCATQAKAACAGVAWNGSQESNEALEWAVQYAERTGAALRLIHVAEPFAAHFERDAELEELRRAAESRVPSTIDIAVGDDPAEELLRFDDLDLMVMGSRANGALRRVAVGSVSSASRSAPTTL